MPQVSTFAGLVTVVVAVAATDCCLRSISDLVI